MNQLQNIFGTCRGNAEVNVVDRQGEVIATTKADASGNWCVEANVTIGSSVRADVSSPGKRRATSDWMEIEQRAEETAEELERREQHTQEMADARQRLEARYTELVCAVADGQDANFEYAADLLEVLGKSLGDFDHDVSEMQRVSRPSLSV
ncbi:hypothetical protein [Lacipirellula sp.]|uniref:hypothetical protein n=1 Tax=Lacipirellula sp. TaxID=2691419 RepID=UPI003D10DF1F